MTTPRSCVGRAADDDLCPSTAGLTTGHIGNVASGLKSTVPRDLPAGRRRSALDSCAPSGNAPAKHQLRLVAIVVAGCGVRAGTPLSAGVRTSRSIHYGTSANRAERDHDGLAGWGSGVRVPSAPPL